MIDESSRFWTRNRPGDSVIDKTDETMTPRASERATGIIFKNIELSTGNSSGVANAATSGGSQLE